LNPLDYIFEQKQNKQYNNLITTKMKNELLPTSFQGINNDVYAGFMPRLGALLLDMLIMLPVIGLVMYLGNVSKAGSLYGNVISIIIGLAYNIILVKIYGGTPGKMIMKLKIIQKNGDDVDWKAAFYRYSVEFFIAFLGLYVLFLTLNMIDDGTYVSLGFLKRSQTISQLNPLPNTIHNLLSGAWTLTGIIVLLTNARKRTTHDFIAGTVVVKSIYLEMMREVVNSTETSKSEIE
jgi:uncharacterized RDD family membrane protein YckC